MYKYDQHDVEFLDQRVNQFRKQVTRYLKKELDDDQFRSVRLKNGLYQELHAYMLRVAIPYGTINSQQLLQLAYIAGKYDKGYGHFTTRQNIQFNWIDLSQMTDILSDLAKVNLHAIQTSGKVIRNITADPLSGVSTNEIADARPYCELIRQWFNLHPEFSWLPGKFKIAVNGSELDEIGLEFHDLGLQIVLNDKKELGFAVYVGGGLGAAPILAPKIKSFVAEQDILSYIESVLRVYNLKGRRDKIKRLRIKFLVKELGREKFIDLVEKDWATFKNDKELKVNQSLISKLKNDFTLPIAPTIESVSNNKVDFNFSIWKSNNVINNKVDGYSIVTVSLSQIGTAPGDITSNQLKQISKLALKYSSDELRITKKQDLILPFVKSEKVFELWKELKIFDLDSPFKGTLAHIVSCPGADFCSLAKTVSIGVAQRIQTRFYENGLLTEIGELDLHVSGCENSCAHHHVADIGLLGLKKGNDAFYQITLGGGTKHKTILGKKLGRAISTEDVVDVIEKIVNVFLENRINGESFNQVFNRISIQPFKERVYE